MTNLFHFEALKKYNFEGAYILFICKLNAEMGFTVAAAIGRLACLKWEASVAQEFLSWATGQLGTAVLRTPQSTLSLPLGSEQ